MIAVRKRTDLQREREMGLLLETWREGLERKCERERERENENSVLVIRSFQDGWGELMKSMLL